ncbi:hypothetical protein [Fusobacterium perfoetens]|uniref:hypothetical protein n=1 Tax=Fusobacterium perfoetens TaxID=852 RepID=UPI001F31FFA5|nr:hypothetical protein [Fusobacterium perfoetens]MCF2611790.1 hypothetical protein [Fusobacterium perfoetens]
MESIRIKDRYNDFKEWEIIKLSGGYYLKQYVKGKQFGRGFRTTKKYIESILEIKISYTLDSGLEIL